MTNLIPPSARKKIIIEYWVRVVSVWLFVVAAVCLLMIIMLLPVYVLVNSQVNAYALSAEEATKKVAQYDLSAGALVKANMLSQKIFDLRQVKHFSPVVSTLESLQGQGIDIEGYEFGRKENSLTPVEVTGRATTRQSLAQFRDVLLKQKNVSDVVLPISNLAKDKDIQFSISIVFKEDGV